MYILTFYSFLNSNPFNILATNVRKRATSSTGDNVDCLYTYSFPRIHILEIKVYESLQFRTHFLFRKISINRVLHSCRRYHSRVSTGGAVQLGDPRYKEGHAEPPFPSCCVCQLLPSLENCPHQGKPQSAGPRRPRRGQNT